MEVSVKILVIQLARLGDILMTWPQIRAIKRLHPEAQIDLLLRPRFKDAAVGLTEINRVIEFPVENIFEPLLEEPMNIDSSLNAVDSIITELRAENYDWVINSTLSPASSYFTHELQTPGTRITGYSRTSDGFLAITDDVSAYIYAQVGVDRDNRIHLSDLFTLMVDAQPTPDDWKTPVAEASPVEIQDYIVLHVGASRADKKFSAFKWRTFISHFQKIRSIPLVLIGNDEESKDASFISLGFDPGQVIDLTGKLKFPQLFPLISKAKAYLGCDSAPLHIASLVGTPALNISLNTVNFWETGPKSLGSRVLFADTEADLPSEKVAMELVAVIDGLAPKKDSIFFNEKSPSYTAPNNTRNQDWTWQMIFALYMGGEWPTLDTNTKRQGLKNLFEVNRVIIDQFTTIRKTKSVGAVSGIIERCEEVIESVGNFVPELSPLIRWYQTQKSLIGPGSPNEILDATEKVHTDFDSIMQFWLTKDIKTTEELDGPSHT